MAKDPICGMTVDESSPLRAERDGETYFFCSDRCRQKFESSPLGRRMKIVLPSALGSLSRATTVSVRR
jgi:YHS domain-containing protein